MGLLSVLSVFTYVASATALPRLAFPDSILAPGSVKYTQPVGPSLQEYAPEEAQNTKPLIGVLSQACHSCPGKSYVAAAYVKWLESAGGRAVPIRFYESEDELRRLFKSVNGLVFPGGLTDLWLDDPYVLAAAKLYQWAKEENDQGRMFPVWGTCLGHQLQMIMTANADFNDLLITTDAVSHPSTLNFTQEGLQTMAFKDMNPDIIKKLGDSAFNISMENHEFGVPPEHFDKWPVLKDTFTIISTTKDRKGATYVSTIQHKKYPFFGTQWHPEKPPYEFSDLTIPHTIDAVHVSQHLANVFIHLARQSPHKPESKEQELRDVIYNYAPVFTARDIVMEPSYDGPDITYFFDPQPGDSNKVLSSKSGVIL
jgi:gamma-glutamyl hydrolase